MSSTTDTLTPRHLPTLLELIEALTSSRPYQDGKAAEYHVYVSVDVQEPTMWTAPVKAVTFEHDKRHVYIEFAAAGQA